MASVFASIATPFFILFLSIWSACAWSSTDLPEVRVDGQGPVKLSPRALRWTPDSPGLDAGKAFSSDLADWQVMPRESIHLGRQEHPVWIRFALINGSDTPLQRILEIRWRNQTELDLYTRNPHSGEVTHFPAGLTTAPADLYELNSSYLFPIALQPHQTIEVALRVKSRLYVFLPTFIWQEQALHKHQQTHFAWYSFAFGIIFAMLAYNLCLWIFTRDRSYAIYCLYASSVIFYQLSVTGIGDWLVWGGSDWMRLNNFAISTNVSFLTATLFIRNFLGVTKIGGVWLRINNFLIAYWCVILLVYLLAPNAPAAVVDTASLMSLFSCIAGLALGVFLWTTGDVSARYFTVAWGGLFALTIVTVLMMVGVLPHNAFTENGQMLGFVVEMVLLSIALADRINRQKRETEAAQKNALQLQAMMIQEREEKLTAQNQLLASQKKVNEHLEERVAERTSALQVALQQVEEANQHLEKLSITDPLTKVKNRRYFDEALSYELEHSARSDKPTSLILVDIDHFKRLNDAYGHLVGDDCLKVVAETLCSIKLRDSDLVARYGGEEFAIILPNTSEDEALLVAERLRSAIEALEFVLDGDRVHISASLGVAGTIAGADTPADDLFRLADNALYHAKSSGRNRSVAARAMV